jgi:hypothetical protein
MSQERTPAGILQLATSFWAAKTLLSAVELKVFTELGQGPLDLQTLTTRLELHPRSARDFFDALVALHMLERHEGKYANTPETDLFLDQSKPAYIGGFLEMLNKRLYPFWGSLTEGLRTGKPQNEAKYGGNIFEALYSDSASMHKFLRAMTGISKGSALAIANQFPWQKYKTFVDIGTAQGDCAAQVALAHHHVTGSGLDLPIVQPVFEEYISSLGLRDRLHFVASDFFKDDLPSADVLIMGHVLHDWNLEEKQLLINKAYKALKTDGALIVYDAIIDDDRCTNTPGLLMSLNMLIETEGGFDYTSADCTSWMRAVGFRHTYAKHLDGFESMVVGIK